MWKRSLLGSASTFFVGVGTPHVFGPPSVGMASLTDSTTPIISCPSVASRMVCGTQLRSMD